jgi:hypothetical protein
MASDDGEVYILAEGDGEWVNPTAAGSLIRERLAAETHLEADDVDGLDAYLDPDDLRAVLAGDADAITVDVEGVAVTVDETGTVEIG